MEQETETSAAPAGKIQFCLPAWRQITQDPWVLEVVKDHPGSLGSGGGEGLPIRTGTNPLPEQPSNISGQVSSRAPNNRSRSPSIIDQRGSKDGKAIKQSIYQQAISDPQKGRVNVTCDQLETPQQIHSQPALQDGGDSLSKGATKRRRLDVLSRPKGCLPLGSNRRAPQEIPLIHMRRHHL